MLQIALFSSTVFWRTITKKSVFQDAFYCAVLSTPIALHHYLFFNIFNIIMHFSIYLIASFSNFYYTKEKSNNQSTFGSSLSNEIKTICNNCNKRFKSTRAIAMHLKTTWTRHSVNFIKHGSYNKDTGMREMKRSMKLNKKDILVKPPSVSTVMISFKTIWHCLQFCTLLIRLNFHLYQ